MDPKIIEALDRLVSTSADSPATLRIAIASVKLDLTGVEFLLLTMLTMKDSPIAALAGMLLGPERMVAADRTLKLKMKDGFDVIREALHAGE